MLRIVVILSAFCLTAVCAQYDYNFAALERHNFYRGRHGAQRLLLDNTLIRNAAACARYYAQIQRMDHTCPFKNGAGENIYSTWTTRAKRSDVSLALEATDWWYDEVQFYNPAIAFNSHEVRHFTQLVWKSSRRVGIAVYSFTRGFETDTYVVALYSPTGNISGQFGWNV